MCFILESSDGFWVWPGLKCVSPDALSSQSHPPHDSSHWPKQCPWGPGTLAVSKRDQQTASEEGGSPESSSSPLSASLLLLVMSRCEDQLLIILLELAEHISPTTFRRRACGMATHLPQYQMAHITLGSVPGRYSPPSCYKYSLRVKDWNEKIHSHIALCNGRQPFLFLLAALNSGSFISWELTGPFIRSSCFRVSQGPSPKY